ncbi:MAG: riboflavin synthase [Planctomycetes bacterium]|nr:riboflavin synthase [Planctomycetota bacterium]
MFTGIVQHVGRITAATPGAAGVRLTLDPCGWSHRPARGDSIAVSGTCLTVVDAQSAAWSFDVVPQTLSRTTLGTAVTQRRVNLEHAVLASTPMGGHIVQGHIDGLGRVAGVQTSGQWRVRIAPPEAVARFIVAQGSITVDGVSLTVADAASDGAWFEIALIPETLERTTLAALAVGDAVNLEADHLSKLIAHEVARQLALRPARTGRDG